MRKPKTELTFVFANPNTPKEIEQILKQILIAKLLALHREHTTADD